MDLRLDLDTKEDRWILKLLENSDDNDLLYLNDREVVTKSLENALAFFRLVADICEDEVPVLINYIFFSPSFYKIYLTDAAPGKLLTLCKQLEKESN